jgi:hypothetical protein
VTTPLPFTEATAGSRVDHDRFGKTEALPSLKVPVPIKSSLVVGAMVALAGDKAIDDNVALSTVNVAADGVIGGGVTVPFKGSAMEAETVVGPMVELTVVNTLGSGPKFVATESLEEDQSEAKLVRSRVLPSLKVPLTENVICVRLGTEGTAGKIEAEARSESPTIKLAAGLFDCPPNDAVTLEVPSVCPTASPLLLVMKPPEEDQVATFVTSCVDPSLKVALAANCCCSSNPMVAVAGVTASDFTITSEDLIVNCALLEMLPEVAEINTVAGDPLPLASAVTKPVLLTVATFGSRQDQSTVPVRSLLLPSEYDPVAVKAWVVPCAMDT